MNKPPPGSEVAMGNGRVDHRHFITHHILSEGIFSEEHYTYSDQVARIMQLSAETKHE